MKIFVFIVILSLILPAIFQLKYGNKSINNYTKMRFGIVCLISIIAQILITLFGIIVIADSLKTPEREFVCGMPIVGYIMISFFIFLIMIIIMGVQLYIKVSHKNKLD